MRRKRSLFRSGIPSHGSEIVRIYIHNAFHDLCYLQCCSFWFQARLERAKTFLINRANQIISYKQLQEAGGFGGRGIYALAEHLKSVISNVAKTRDWLNLFQNIHYLEELHFVLLCVQVLGPLVTRNPSNQYLRCCFRLLPSPRFFFF